MIYSIIFLVIFFYSLPLTISYNYDKSQFLHYVYVCISTILSILYSDNILVALGALYVSRRIVREIMIDMQLIIKYSHITKKNDKCSICFDVLKNGIIQLSCEHQYHYTCIASWFSVRKTCPLCRQKIE